MRSFDMTAGSFPAGATISVVAASAGGVVVSTAVADPDGGAELLGLIHGTHYIASAGGRSVSFVTDPLPDPPIYNPLDFLEGVGMGNAAIDSAAIQEAGDQSRRDIGVVDVTLTSPPGATAYFVQGVTWGSLTGLDGWQVAVRGQSGWRNGTRLMPGDPAQKMFEIFGPGDNTGDGIAFERLFFAGTANRPFDVPLIDLRQVRGWLFDQCGLEYDGSGTFLYTDSAYLGEIRRPSLWRARLMVPWEQDAAVPLPAFPGPAQTDTMRADIVAGANSQPIILRGSQKESHGFDLSLKHVNGYGDKGGSAGEPTPGFHFTTLSAQCTAGDVQATLVDAARFRGGDFITVGNTLGQVEIFEVATVVGAVATFKAGQVAAFTHASGQRVRKLSLSLLARAYDAGASSLRVMPGLGPLFAAGNPATVGFGNAIDAAVIASVATDDVSITYPLRFPKGKSWSRVQLDTNAGSATLHLGAASGPLAIAGRVCTVGVPGNQETLTIQSVASNVVTWTTPTTKKHLGGAPVSTACGKMTGGTIAGAVALTLDDATLLRKYQRIVIAQSTAREEVAIIDSVDTTTGVLTFATGLTNAHNAGDLVDFCSLLTTHGVALSVGENIHGVKASMAHLEDVPIGALLGRVKGFEFDGVAMGAAVAVFRADDCEDVRIKDVTALGQPTGSVGIYTPPWVEGSTNSGRFEVIGAQQSFSSAWMNFRQLLGDFSRAQVDWETVESGARILNQSRPTAATVVRRLYVGMNKRLEMLADGSIKFWGGTAGSETLGGTIQRWADALIGSGDAGWLVARTNDTDLALATRKVADAQARFIARAAGALRWGDGTATTDTELNRRGVSALQVVGQLQATNGLATRYTAGAGKTTVVDADFTGGGAATPVDGTIAFHYDTTASKAYVSGRFQGAWIVLLGPI